MTNKKTKTTEISELGEFKLIDHLTAKLNISNKSTVKGVGDDAAILDYTDKKIVLSTEIFTEGVHFNLMYFPLKHLGYKIVVAGISDICAMNAIPRQIMLSLALSGKFSVEALNELYEGVHLACEQYGVDLIGGDTTSSLTGLVVNITAIGEASEKELVYRNGAKENDLLCVSGDLGGAYMGLQLLERENEVFKANPEIQPRLEGYDYILQRQLKPEARTDIKGILKKLDIQPTSMIDISDGLASEIMHLCKASGLGCRLCEENVPLDMQTKAMADELSINPLVAALNGGEDFELLFTVRIEDHEKIKNDTDITILGHMTNAKEGMNLVTTGGSFIALTAQGWKNEK